MNSPLRLARKYLSRFRSFLNLDEVKALRDLVLLDHNRQIQQAHPNPLNKFGKKCFSSTDEDGITLEILRRMNCLHHGVFAEFGVGNGTENNTLVLAALGWKGFWVGGEALSFQVNAQNPRFCYSKNWITRENIAGLAKEGLAKIGEKTIDVLSIDLDGNDFYFIEELLANSHKPKLIILEYNAKFPPPIEFKVEYDAHRGWAGDDYFGASLTSFAKLLAKFNYRLVCCNSHTGSNAFFIDASFSEAFSDIPTDINLIYVEPRYYLYHGFGHRPSLTTIKQIINGS
jgi:hypothetical protein